MVVTEIGTEADGSRYIQVTEVNEDYETCRISWGRTITEDELYGLGDTVQILTRYAED